MRRMRGISLVGALVLSQAAIAQAVSERLETPRSGVIELKIGTYRPRLDDEAALGGATPFRDTFGSTAMWLPEIEYDRMVYQGFGTAAVGLAVGYTEKFGRARVAGTGEPSAESTLLRVVPIRLLGVYRFDWPLRTYAIPLVPYAKLGLVYAPWWVTKGGKVEEVDGARAVGGRWGYALTGGLAFQLDVLEPRLQRDFDSEWGVNHTYAFAEYTLDEVNGFGSQGFNLSSSRFSFGLAFEF